MNLWMVYTCNMKSSGKFLLAKDGKKESFNAWGSFNIMQRLGLFL